MSEAIHKLIITGTGRAGTTFLVQLLTGMGLDTGYSGGRRKDDYFEHCSAGLERGIFDEGSPYIVKDPRLCETLPVLLATERLVVDHAIVAVRDLEDAARSRIRIGGRNGDVPGGLLWTDDPAAQKGVLAEHFHLLIHTLVANDIPHTLLHFPRFATDAAYAQAKLGFLAPALGLPEFREIFATVSRPELIHQFGPEADREAGRAAAQFRAAHQRKRRRRRLRRVAFVLGAVAVGVAAVRMIAERTVAQ